MKPRYIPRLVAGSCLLLLAAGILAFQSGRYHLIKNIPLGAAAGGGEYFDYIAFDVVCPWRLPLARYGDQSA